jgi:predicted DNA-binding transcriptional regulator YafY
MASTSSRMLQLLSLLQTHRHWPGPELAGRLEVSERTLRRDVDRLRELGYPVDASRGVDGGYQLGIGAALPPLVLDDEEAVALAVGLQGAAHSSVARIAESSVSALTKVIQVMPPRLRRRVDTLRAMTVPAAFAETVPEIDPGLLTTVAQACRDDERLAFSYTAAGGARTERVVEPHRLVSLGRRWYLVAYDDGRGNWRSFRLDRLTGLHGTGERFLPRTLPADDAAEFVRHGITDLSAPYVVEVLVAAPADGVRGQVGRWADVEEIDATHCRVRMSTDDLDWPAFALGLLRAEFTVVGPPEMTARVAEWAARFARSADVDAPPDRNAARSR